LLDAELDEIRAEQQKNNDQFFKGKISDKEQFNKYKELRKRELELTGSTGSRLYQSLSKKGKRKVRLSFPAEK